AVLSLEDAQEQVEFAREVVTRKLSKSTTESLAAARSKRPAKRTVTGTASDVHVRAVAEELTRDLGTRVRITSRARGGCIEIEYYSDAELDRLLERLRAGSPTSA